MAAVSGTTSSGNGVDKPPDRKPKPEDFERPVAWLFGRQLIANLKWWRYSPIWVLLGMAVLAVVSSLWFFGMYEAAFLISDLNLLLVLLGVGIGLIYFAWGTGANLKKWPGKIPFTGPPRN